MANWKAEGNASNEDYSFTNRLSDEVKQDILTKYLINGWSQENIAKNIHFSVSEISRVTRCFGFYDGKSRGKYKKFKGNDITAEDILAFINEYPQAVSESQGNNFENKTNETFEEFLDERFGNMDEECIDEEQKNKIKDRIERIKYDEIRDKFLKIPNNLNNSGKSNSARGRQSGNKKGNFQSFKLFAAAPIVIYLLGSLFLFIQFDWFVPIWKVIALPGAIVTGIWSYFRYKKSKSQNGEKSNKNYKNKQVSYANNSNTNISNSNRQNKSTENNHIVVAAPIIVFLLGSIILVSQFSWYDQLWQIIAVPGTLITGIWSYMRYKRSNQ